MSLMIELGLVLAVIAGLIGFIVWYSKSWESAGQAKEKLQETEHDLDAVQREGKIMAQNRTPEDVARKLDSGTF